MSTEPTHPRGASPTATGTDAIHMDAVRIALRLMDRLDAAADTDVETLRWLHRRLVAIERSAQERGVAR